MPKKRPAAAGRREAPDGLYAIHRHKAAINAWCWRVNFRRRGKEYAKSFSDLKHGVPPGMDMPKDASTN